MWVFWKCGYNENEWMVSHSTVFSHCPTVFDCVQDPSPNQRAINSFCVCIVTPAGFLLCIGWLYFDVRLWGHLVTLCGCWWAPVILTTANVKRESRVLGRKRPFDQHNVVSPTRLLGPRTRPTPATDWQQRGVWVSLFSQAEPQTLQLGEEGSTVTGLTAQQGAGDSCYCGRLREQQNPVNSQLFQN